jgi:type I restriction enzyme R subunit
MKTATFNEDSRVKIPAIIHLSRLGYKYLSKDTLIDSETNIFIEVFKKYCDKKHTI